MPAAYDALLRGAQMAETAPRAPVYVNLDAALQEQKLEAMPALPDPARFAAPESPLPAPELIRRAADLLSGASAPVILAGRLNRSEASWRARVALAEKLGARVLTDLKTGSVFPTRAPAARGPARQLSLGGGERDPARADVVLALDWVDLAGTFKQAFGDQAPTAKVISASCDVLLHRGFSMDYFGLPPVDVNLLAEPDVVVPRLLEACRARQAAPPSPAAPDMPPLRTGDVMSLRSLAEVFNAATSGLDVCLTRLPLGWRGAYRDFAHPLDYLGNDGGAGVGSGPGLTVGAALALRGTGRVPIALLGDGDYLMGVTAIWTAAHYGIPCLFVICNNRSFYNDEAHQERVAIIRNRPVENKWIGQRIGDPDMDLAMMAVAQGAKGIGPGHPARPVRRRDEGRSPRGDGRRGLRDRRARAPGLRHRRQRRAPAEARIGSAPGSSQDMRGETSNVDNEKLGMPKAVLATVPWSSGVPSALA